MKTVIEMAREAAGAASDWALFREFMPEIHKLAELVRAQENEACALIADEAEPYNAADLIRKRTRNDYRAPNRRSYRSRIPDRRCATMEQGRDL